MRPSVALAALAAAAILAPLAALSVRLSGTVGGSEAQDVIIGIDHQHAASLELTATRSRGKLLLVARNASSSGLGLLIPATWKRQEVRNASIDDVSLEPPVLGMRRAGLPPGVSVSFAAPFPSSLSVHAAGEAPLKVTIITVDVDAGTSTRDVRLVQQSTISLWGE